MNAATDLSTGWPTGARPVPVDLPPTETAPTAAGRLGEVEGLEAGIDPLQRVADAVPSSLRPLLAGEWLGHPLHPMLTDLAIGFWTSAWALDLIGGKRGARAATVLVGLGVASAVPTVASGLVDWGDMDDRPKRRVGVVHAAANLTATALYATSFVQRCRGQRGRGIATGMVAAGVATIGGYLGGHLAFGEGS